MSTLNEEERIDVASPTDFEQRDLDALNVDQQNMLDYLMDNKYEIDFTFKNRDWLEIYAKAILEQNVDFTAIAQTGD